MHFVCVSDEESEELDDRGSDYLVEQGYLGDFAITGEPTDLHIGIQAKGVLAMRDRGERHRRARLDAVGGRQRGAEGDRHLPPDREPAVRARVLGPVRPAVDQPRPDRRRRRDEQGARPLRDRRGRALPPGPGPRGDPRCGRSAAGRARGEGLPPPAGDRRRATTRTCRRSARRSRAWRSPRASGSASAATAPRTRSRSSRPACRRWSAARPGDGHHGPEEWVSIRSLGQYRAALVEFVEPAPGPPGGEDDRRLRIA